MDKIKQRIIEKRPNLSKGSVATYFSLLKSLWNKHHDKSTAEVDMKWFENQDTILKSLDTMDIKSRKTLLSALVVICEKCDKYRERMLKDLSEVKAESKTQVKSEKQERDWVSQEEIKALYDAIARKTKHLLTQTSLTNPELQELQNLIILAVSSGIHGLEPRRLLDWTEFRIRGDYDRKTSNYKKGKTLYFNVYKTAKTYGEETIDTSPKLNTLLNKWIKLNPHDYLLVDTNGNKLTSVKLNQRFGKIFSAIGKPNTSANIMRHSFLSSKYANMPSIKDLEETAKNMGHSVPQMLEYIKHEQDE
jgi:integrase